MPFAPTLPERPSARQVADQLLEAGQYLHGLRATPQDSDDWKRDVRSATDFILSYDPIMEAIKAQEEVAILEQMLKGVKERGPRGATRELGNPGNRTAGDLYTDRDEYRAYAARHAFGHEYLEYELKGMPYAHNALYRDNRALITTLPGSGDDFLTVAQPVPPVPRERRLFIRDLMTVQTTGLSHVPYIRESDPVGGEGGASAVAEGSAKPEVSMNWTLDDAPVRKIAAWVPITEEVIEDAPTLRGYIDGRLTYLLAIREENDVLTGPGTGVRLKGITAFGAEGLQTQAMGTDRMVSLGLAIGKIENVDGEADGMAINPITFWTMITDRQAEQFDGSGSIGVSTIGFPFVAPNVGPWGLPCVRSRALPTEQAIVGAWRMGATLFDRMQTVIRVGNQHSTYFIENKIVVLAEERVALAVHRPDYFVHVS